MKTQAIFTISLGLLLLNSGCTQSNVSATINSSVSSTTTSGGSSTTSSTSGGGAPLVCPSNYVKVPALSGYTTSDFCIAKYEMKNVGNVATSQVALAPWHTITKNDSVTACQALGTGYDLITNEEWQTVARNLEGVSFNRGNPYSDPHQTFMSAGRKSWDGGAATPVAADVDSNPCYLSDDGQGSDDSGFLNESGGVCNLSTWNRFRRVSQLSNNEYIWDFSGNVTEWINYTPSAADNQTQSGIENFYGASWGGFWMARVLDSTGPFEFNMKTRYGPSGDYTAHSWLGTPGDYTTEENWAHDNMGTYYAQTISNPTATDALMRGEDGIFSVEFIAGTYTSTSVGFRCVYHGE